MTLSRSIYQQPRPLAAVKHANWFVEDAADFGFAANFNAVPLVTNEFASVALEYPIVFLESESGVTPVALVGLRDGENLFVGADGRWLGRYVPAILRQYPFGFAKVDQGQKVALCIDEGAAKCNVNGIGQALFDQDGSNSPYLSRMLDMAKNMERASQATQQFCARLSELGLFEERQMTFTETDGQKALVRGFQMVSQERLNALSGDVLKELQQGRGLELIYAHLVSLGQRERLAERLGPKPVQPNIH